ncbi:PHP domain-containing protein [Halanaerobium saccharolyticum]|uniref:PHP domain-containing protein n=1 Tax=Halanaerobium saccharolyticum TaxID=43595 RepID=UPI00126717C2
MFFLNRYKIELHAHSSESSRCGSVEAAELVEKYINAGYSALVLTDHYYARFFDKFSDLSWEKKLEKYLEGYKNAKEAAGDSEFKVFLGIEIKFSNDPNEYLIYGLNEEFLLKYPNLHHLNLEKFKNLAETDEAEILIFQAHPYRQGMAPADIRLIDGLEVYNGNPRHNSNNDKALNYAKKNNLKMISGSDFHEYEDLARGGIVSKELPLKINELCNLLKTGNYNLIKAGKLNLK